MSEHKLEHKCEIASIKYESVSGKQYSKKHKYNNEKSKMTKKKNKNAAFIKIEKALL